MKPTLFLHAGLPKTGTSALQKWLRVNRDVLLPEGLDYADPGITEEDKHVFLVAFLRGARGEAELTRTLSERRCNRVLLSNEGLANHLYDFTPERLGVLRQLTADWHVEVILLRRDPERWLRSYHRQCVLSPPNGASPLWGTHLTAEALRSHPRIRALLDHETLGRDMRAAYGAQRIHLLDYDDPDWMTRFCEITGLAARDAAVLPRENSSLPDWMIDVLRELNRLAPGMEAWHGWRQVARRCFEEPNVLLDLAASRPAVPVAPELLDRFVPPAHWSPADHDGFARFRAAACPALQS